VNYAITHRTVYEYAAPVAVSHHVTRLEPRASGTQSCVDFSLKIFPEPDLQRARTDYFGNRLCFFAIQEVHQRLEIVTRSRVTVTPPQVPAPDSTPRWETVAEMFRDPVSPEVIEPYQFVFDSPHVRASEDLAAYALESFAAGTPLLAGAAELTRRIFNDFKFDPVATTVATPLEEVWRTRRGVCQDFAHLARRGSLERTPATRGSEFFVPAPAGWTLIRPTIFSRARSTSSSRMAGILATSVRWPAFLPAEGSTR
jgi:transglutaminase-like putative cysteine protease